MGAKVGAEYPGASVDGTVDEGVNEEKLAVGKVEDGESDVGENTGVAVNGRMLGELDGALLGSYMGEADVKVGELLKNTGEEDGKIVGVAVPG